MHRKQNKRQTSPHRIGTLPAALLISLLPLFCAAANAAAPASSDCALFREGGAGKILQAPVYWLRGTVIDTYRRPHRFDVCPLPANQPPATYSRADWRRLADAWPCVSQPAARRDGEVSRVRLRVDAWETPWSNAHGYAGWLYRGHFLDVELQKGLVIDIDASLLGSCPAD